MGHKMLKVRLGWFGYVKRRYTIALVRNCKELAMDGYRRDRDRSKEYREK